ncbi:MAG: trans-aconitate 2-methyltransferase [Terriglobia bacterium]|nr:MAG: trans-aconitate 2-methyltransferase [Terriglobia bacterium]
MPQWDADLYLKFGDERTQPVRDLIHRIQLTNPRRIMDLGCGPGNSTAELRRRWPLSAIAGLDNSPEMIAKARESFPGAQWEVADAASWKPPEPFDLVFSNAMLHWLPDHGRLCRHFMEQVTEGGALAVQVPAHYDSPLHREILDVSHDPMWDAQMAAARQRLTHQPPAFYYGTLQPVARHVDLWETTYYHVLAGPEAVVEWFRGTGLRPFLEALPGKEERARFESLLLERYRVVYPRQNDGKILFPFRRLFFIAYR